MPVGENPTLDSEGLRGPVDDRDERSVFDAVSDSVKSFLGFGDEDTEGLAGKAKRLAAERQAAQGTRLDEIMGAIGRQHTDFAQDD